MNAKLIGLAPLILLGACSSGTECTTKPQADWLSQDEMKRLITESGYRIKEFKVAGSCYEIYGWDEQNRKVEIYFDPVTGTPVKTEIE
jgi:hypothetical protein